MPFILRRLAFYLVAAWVALTANFFLPRAMPGNAVQAIMSKFPNLQPSAYKALEAMLGVGHPGSLWHQYVSYLYDVVHLNFGTDLAIIAGWRHGGAFDRALPGLMFFQAVPYFFLALILIDLLAVRSHVF